jgi:molybdopterin-guanine dinucleotide biosynthesis protein MobB
LVKHGYRVATVKHVSQKNFTMDTEGKDTWRHARAGAVITTTVAANEIATIQRGSTSNYGIEDMVKPFEDKVDIVVFEGFRKLMKEEGIPKIVAVKNREEALLASGQFRPLVAFVGPYATEELGLKIPYVDVIKNPDKLATIVIERIERT